MTLVQQGYFAEHAWPLIRAFHARPGPQALKGGIHELHARSELLHRLRLGHCCEFQQLSARLVVLLWLEMQGGWQCFAFIIALAEETQELRRSMRPEKTPHAGAWSFELSANFPNRIEHSCRQLLAPELPAQTSPNISGGPLIALGLLACLASKKLDSLRVPQECHDYEHGWMIVWSGRVQERL